METIQEKENEISNLKEEIPNLNNKKKNNAKEPNKNNGNLKNHNSLKPIHEVNNSITPEENKTDELLELYKKIKVN